VNKINQGRPAENSYRGFFRKVWLSVVLVWESDWRYGLANVGLLFLQAIIPLLLLYVIKSIVDLIVETDGRAAGTFSDPLFRDIGILFAIGAALAIAQNTFSAASQYVRSMQTLKVIDHVRSMLQTKAMDADLALFETPKYWDALYRTQREAAHRPRTMVESLLRIVGEGGSALVMVGVLISFHWIVLPALLLAAVPGVIHRLKTASGQYNWERDATPEDRYGSYVDRIITAADAAKEMRGFGLGELLRGQFLEIRKKFRSKRQAHAKQRAIVDSFSKALVIVVVFGMLLVIAKNAVSGAMTAGEFIVFFAAMQRTLSHVRQILDSFTSLFEDTLFVSDFHEIMALKPTIVDPDSPKPIPPASEMDIRFQGVSFAYQRTDPLVLKDISFNIKPGQNVAFVGPNGSGKTTLIKLLCRFYDPIHGTITFGGTDLRQFPVRGLRKQFSYAFQDFARYQMSAHDNIWLGDHARLAGLEKVQAAAEKSGADQIVADFPDGYRSILGHEFLGGQELSGGQWQRFALARFFVRDAPILLLDEPLSAVDAVAEEHILDALQDHMKGHTTITISHRLSAIRHADRIFVLDQGRIVENGCHDELVQGGGLYARMFEAQARKYG